MIKLGEKIKELRLRDGRTQEALAAELGVTAQAVSRWEKQICCPDIEMVPSIANYFGVSIDELFGYDNERSKKADALAERINAMNAENNGRDVSMDACISLAREALIEFPGNERLTLELASALYNAGYVRRGEHHIEGPDGFARPDAERHKKYPEWQEAVKLYEKLLPLLQDGAMRQRAVTELAQLYSNLGESEKALALAESAPEITCAKPFLRIKAFEGKGAVEARGEALIETLMSSAELMVQIVLADRRLPPRTCAQILQSAEGLFECVCPDQSFGRIHGLLACIQMLRSYYLGLADDMDEAFSALDSALDHAGKLDALSKTAPEFFPSPVLRLVRIHAERVPKDSAFSKELPDLWPWWDVPERDRVLGKMQADPRFELWVRRTAE